MKLSCGAGLAGVKKGTSCLAVKPGQDVAIIEWVVMT